MLTITKNGNGIKAQDADNARSFVNPKVSWSYAAANIFITINGFIFYGLVANAVVNGETPGSEEDLDTALGLVFPSPGQSGSSTGLDYDAYPMYLTQEGLGAPVLKMLQDNGAIEFSSAYLAVGLYLITVINITFLEGKTAIIAPQNFANVLVSGRWQSLTGFTIATTNLAGDSIDDALTENFVEVRIYKNVPA